jgi:hypothetical protein
MSAFFTLSGRLAMNSRCRVGRMRRFLRDGWAADKEKNGYQKGC